MKRHRTTWSGRKSRWLAGLALLVVLAAMAAGPTAAVAQGGTCIDDVTGRTNNCTANDVRLSQLRNNADISCTAGSTVEVTLRAELVAGASERYDIGMFVALDGGFARTGTCHRDYVPPPLADQGQYNPGSPFPGAPGGPFLDAELDEDPPDECGDLEQGVNNYYDLTTLTVPCNDSNGDGLLDIGTCVSWDNQKTNTCLDVNGAVPNTKAKCRCEVITVGNVIVIPGEIVVTKVAAPDSVQEPGGDVVFTFTVQNTSQVAVTVETLVDSIYGDLTTYTGSTCTVPQPLAAGATYSCSITSPVSGAPGVQTDTVTATGTDENGGPVSDDASEVVVITDVPPLLAVVKEVSPETVWEPGGPVTYTVSVTNNSGPSDPVTLSGLVDDVYGDLTDPANPKISDSTCTLATIAPGATYTCTFHAQVSGKRGDSITDVVTATGTDDEGNPAEDSDDARVVIDFPDTGVKLPPPLVGGGLALIGSWLVLVGVLARRRIGNMR